MIQMHNADCMDFMREVPDKYYDLAIVDPPYGIGMGKTGSYHNLKGKRPSNPHTKKDWDNGIPPVEYWEELFRVSKNQIVWGGNYMTEFLSPSRCWIFWDKMKFVDNYADGELAWTSFDRNTKKVLIQHHGFLTKDGKSIHPTQKPVMLYEWLLMNYAKEGDKILDTHGGSGSICIACHNLGFDLDWIELDKEYFDAATKRFKQHAAQLRIM
jgi:site-specific DNA-methyltransferase (adenine-specific)